MDRFEEVFAAYTSAQDKKLPDIEEILSWIDFINLQCAECGLWNSWVNVWLKDVAPSTELRKWFSHDPAKWNQFRRRYRAELGTRAQIWQPLLETARQGIITLLYSSHDTEHNNAVVLKEFLEAKLSHGKKAA